MYFSATHSRLKPIISVEKMFKRHIENIITYAKHRITKAFAEGINSVIQHIEASARGFRNFLNYRTAILFYCGNWTCIIKSAEEPKNEIRIAVGGCN